MTFFVLNPIFYEARDHNNQIYFMFLNRKGLNPHFSQLFIPFSYIGLSQCPFHCYQNSSLFSLLIDRIIFHVSIMDHFNNALLIRT